LLYPREHYCQKQKQKPGRISLRRHSSLHFKVGTEILLQYSTARCHLWISWRVFQFQVLFSMLFRCCHQPLQVRIRTPEAVVNHISFSLGRSWISREQVVFMIKMFYWPNQSMWLNSIDKTNLGKTQKQKQKLDRCLLRRDNIE
jgi:hypothetical protein